MNVPGRYSQPRSGLIVQRLTPEQTAYAERHRLPGESLRACLIRLLLQKDQPFGDDPLDH